MNATATPATDPTATTVTLTLPAICIRPGDIITHRFLDEPLLVGSTETLGDHIEVYAADTDPATDTPDLVFKTDHHVRIVRPAERFVATETVTAPDLEVGDYAVGDHGDLFPVVAVDDRFVTLDLRRNSRYTRNEPVLVPVGRNNPFPVHRAVLREAFAS